VYQKRQYFEDISTETQRAINQRAEAERGEFIPQNAKRPKRICRGMGEILHMQNKTHLHTP
jgi:hypothetical protein